MKKVYLLILASVMLYSCNLSSDSKAKSNIEKYMKENINDPTGYVSVRFGELRSDSTMMDEDKQYKVYEDSLALIQSERDDLKYRLRTDRVTYATYLSQEAQYLRTAIDVLQRQRAWMSAYVFHPCGFNIMHVYRKKNEKGGVVLDSMCFRVDSAYNVKPKKYYSLINR